MARWAASSAQREIIAKLLYTLNRRDITTTVQMSTTLKRSSFLSAMAPPSASSTIFGTIRQYWGFEQLRPQQSEAIDAALAGRDSLVVLPTGGGKSLCYQVPPAVSGGTDIVISPLISLMKDQVDGLTECGYPAAAIYTGLDSGQRSEI